MFHLYKVYIISLYCSVFNNYGMVNEYIDKIKKYVLLYFLKDICLGKFPIFITLQFCHYKSNIFFKCKTVFIYI